MSRPYPFFMRSFAGDLRAARRRLHMTVPSMASQIGISASTLRRIENGTSRNTRGETCFAVMAWAASRGYREFGGFPIERNARKAGS